jgi:alpha-ribazole phosphatase/probable phosphoglycerate mutase
MPDWDESMITKVYLIRHGETHDADSSRYKGHIDVPLSEEGIKQMERVSAFISAEVQKCRSSKTTSKLLNFRTSILSAIYCSDLSRAVKSAEIIAKPYKLIPIRVPELRERNFGIWEGMTFDEIKEKHLDEFEAWSQNPLKHSPPNGESTLEVKDRLIKAMEKIMEDARWKRKEKGSSINIAIVAHGGVNRIILCHFLGIPLENIFRIEQDFGCLNVIEFYDGYPVVKLINYTVQTV